MYSKLAFLIAHLKITSLPSVTFSINVQYNFALHSGHCAFIRTIAVAVFLIFLNAQGHGI